MLQRCADIGLKALRTSHQQGPPLLRRPCGGWQPSNKYHAKSSSKLPRICSCAYAGHPIVHR